jgi:hypothetical protein
VALALVTACGGASPPASGPGQPGADPAATADRTATLRYAHNSGFGILDPQRTPNYFGGQIAMRPVYDSLLTLQRGADGTVAPAPQLATDWKVADDGLSITFHLRPNLKFQDGTALDATAVKANLERATAPDSTIRSQLPSLTSVEAADPTTVVLHLSQPDSSVLWAMATNTTGMMASPAAFANLAKQPVGSGPYKLVSATDSEITYQRWDGYWDPDAALANQLVISTVPDVNARYTGVRSGQFDVAFLASPLDAQSKELQDQGYHWRSVLSPISTGVLLNATEKPFDDVRVRRAVSMAINRTQISQNLLGGMNPPAYQTFLKGFLGNDPSTAHPGGRRDGCDRHAAAPRIGAVRRHRRGRPAVAQRGRAERLPAAGGQRPDAREVARGQVPGRDQHQRRPGRPGLHAAGLLPGRGQPGAARAGAGGDGERGPRAAGQQPAADPGLPADLEVPGGQPDPRAAGAVRGGVPGRAERGGQRRHVAHRGGRPVLQPRRCAVVTC